MTTTDSGTYFLLIELQAHCEATIGRLGRFVFPRGYYAYCGSARRGLRARLARHRRADKKLHWHIDHLLAQPAARLLLALPLPLRETDECALSQSFQQLPGASVPVRGFGSSDCRKGCPAHLVYLGEGQGG